MSTLSEWQTGKPPCDGIWEIEVKEWGCTYFARFKDGKWGGGYCMVSMVQRLPHAPFPDNNNPKKPRRWRGLIG